MGGGAAAAEPGDWLVGAVLSPNEHKDAVFSKYVGRLDYIVFLSVTIDYDVSL